MNKKDNTTQQDKKEYTVVTDGEEKAAKKGKSVKKVFLVPLAVAAAIGVIALVFWLALTFDRNGGVTDEFSFFEADYSENVFDDPVYMNLDRRIWFSRFGDKAELTPDSANGRGAAALMFYRYFNSIINGDYERYPSFFTESYLNGSGADIPSKFTMQKLYDINIELFSSDGSDKSVIKEIYEVRYAIFENNGTFRRDIPSMKTRTLVFEVYIFGNGEAKINSVAFRKNA